MIRKFEPEIKNHCTLEGVSRQKPAVIPKSGPEIKSRCSRGLVAVCRRNHSLLPQRKLETDTDLIAATTTAGGPFSFVATEIRIGRGRSLPRRLLQAGHSPLRQRKLGSDAEGRCRNDCCRRNYSPLHRFASLSPKSRITARWRAFPGKNLQ